MNKKGQEWLNTPTPEILKNISSFIDYLYDLDSFEDYDEADTLKDLLLAMPLDRLVSALIVALDGDDGEYPYEHAICFPNVWFGLALNPDSRKELIAQLSTVGFDKYIFSFLNGIDEGDETPGEIAIRSVLDELGYLILRDSGNDWSPDGKYKRVTRRRTIELRTDPVANFSKLIDAVLYYDSTSYEDFLQPVTNAIQLIQFQSNGLASLLVSDLINRGSVGVALFEYAQCWLHLVNSPAGAEALVDQLINLPGDSCVITYLNGIYRFQIADDPDHPLLIKLRDVLKRANVFIEQALNKTGDAQ